jgi:tetratricopeptide (TPR) repeat protein
LWHRGDAELERSGDPKPWFDRALKDFEEALRLRPRFWQVHANRALLFERLGRREEAAAEIEKALALQPEHPGLRRELERIRRGDKR